VELDLLRIHGDFYRQRYNVNVIAIWANWIVRSVMLTWWGCMLEMWY